MLEIVKHMPGAIVYKTVGDYKYKMGTIKYNSQIKGYVFDLGGLMNFSSAAKTDNRPPLTPDDMSKIMSQVNRMQELFTPEELEDGWE